MRRLLILLGLKRTGALIEWTFVVLVNLALILYCSLYGAYDTVNPLHGTDYMIAIVLGPLIGCIIYSLFYLGMLCLLEDMPNGIFDIRLWAPRLFNMLYQVVHACLFVLFLSLNTKATVILAFWIYGLIPCVIAVGYFTFVLVLHIRAILDEDYKEYLEKIAQTDYAIKPNEPLIV